MTIGREEFERKLYPRADLELKDIQLIMLAYRLAKYGHRNQKRDDGERYFEHPKRVALILMDECGIFAPIMLITALLHDIKEDSFILTWDDIELIFGNEVRKMIEILTKGNEAYLQRIENSPKEVKTIKLSDRLDNIRDMAAWALEKRKEYIEETKTIYLPMAKEVNECLYQEIKEICKKYNKELSPG